MLLCVVQVVVLGVRPSVPPNMPEDFELLMKRYVPQDMNNHTFVFFNIFIGIFIYLNHKGKATCQS